MAAVMIAGIVAKVFGKHVERIIIVRNDGRALPSGGRSSEFKSRENNIIRLFRDICLLIAIGVCITLKSVNPAV